MHVEARVFENVVATAGAKESRHLECRNHALLDDESWLH